MLEGIMKLMEVHNISFFLFVFNKYKMWTWMKKKVKTVNADLHVHISTNTDKNEDATIALLDLLMNLVDVSFNLNYIWVVLANI